MNNERRHKLVSVSDIALYNQLNEAASAAKVAVDNYYQAAESAVNSAQQFGLYFLAKVLHDKLKDCHILYPTQQEQ